MPSKKHDQSNVLLDDLKVSFGDSNSRRSGRDYLSESDAEL